MKGLRQIMLLGCTVMALVAAAQQPDPVISSIRAAYQQAKESMKKNKSKGNEMVTTLNYTVYGKGKTTEKLHFFYNTDEGTYWLAEGDNRDPHFNFYPLYFVTRSYNIGKQKYYEEYLFDASSQRLLFALTQDYDENGKRFDRRYYFQDGNIYDVVGPPVADDFMMEMVIYQADELRHAFDWIIRNPKE
ncbi:MAG: hypothetical protein IKX18_03360 [Muribaculaceae bacterium]|nr:hypothetical protein [Muribaculaceae bacterium]